MNYKLDNPVALKVIECIMADKPLAMANIKYMITNNNATFEQALNVCILSRLRSRVYRKISQMYHMDIRIFNMNKLNRKKGINNNE